MKKLFHSKKFCQAKNTAFFNKKFKLLPCNFLSGQRCEIAGETNLTWSDFAWQPVNRHLANRVFPDLAGVISSSLTIYAADDPCGKWVVDSGCGVMADFTPAGRRRMPPEDGLNKLLAERFDLHASKSN